jgi:hypothetical protein
LKVPQKVAATGIDQSCCIPLGRLELVLRRIQCASGLPNLFQFEDGLNFFRPLGWLDIADGKKVKADDLVRAFSGPNGGDLK